MNKATQDQVKALVAEAKQSGKSDMQIYDALKRNPALKQNFASAKEKGFDDVKIARGLGLNINGGGQASKSNVQNQAQQQPKNTPKADDVKPEQPSALVRIGSGMDNVFSGIKQGGLYLKDGITGGNEYEKFTAEKKAEKESYEQAKKDSGFSGIDFAEMLGETVALGPLATAGRGYQGAKVLSKAGAKVTAQNAGLGAVGAGVGFAENADKRMDNMTVGAITAPVGGYVGEKLLGKPIAKMMTRHSVTDDVAKTAVNKGLAKEGLKLDDLPTNVADDLVKQAKKALKAGKTLDDDVVGRTGLIKKYGINPTKAQANRKAFDWADERQTAKFSEQLSDKFIDDDKQLAQLLDTIKDGTGGTKTGDVGLKDLSTNQQLLEAANAKIAQNKAKARQAYEQARQASGNDLDVDAKGFASEARKALQDNYNWVMLPPQIKKMLKDVEKDGLTYGQSEEIIKLLNKVQSSNNKSGNMAEAQAVSMVRDVLDSYQQKAVNGISAGETTSGLWQNARSVHAQNRQLIESMPLLRDAEKGVKTDELINKYIINGKNDELKRTVQFLEKENPQLLANVRQSVIEHIASKAVNSSGTFNPKGYADIIKNIRTDRLEAIFGADTAKQMKEVGRVAHYLQQEVGRAPHNHSGTTWGLIKELSKLANIPTGGKANVITNLLNYNQARKMLKGASLVDNTVPITYSPSGQKASNAITKLGVITGINADE